MLSKESLCPDKVCDDTETADLSIYGFFEKFAKKHKDKLFLSDEAKVYTVREAFDAATSLADRIYDFGVKKGTLVAVRATRTVETCLIYFALQFIGAVAVLCDPHSGINEFIAVSGTAIRPQFFITDESGEWLLFGEGKSHLINFRGNGKVKGYLPATDINAPSTVIFTSGSTGRCKAVVLSQKNINCVSTDTRPLGWYLPDDIAAVIVPLHHVFAVSLIVTAVVAGYALFFPESIDINDLLDCIEKRRITRMNGVPSLYLSMAKTNENLKMDVSSLRTGFIGGAPVSEEQFRYIEKTLGVTMISIYGMSECMAITCTSYLDSADERSGSVGKFYPMSRGYILDENGNELPAGNEGEICVKSPAVMIGYFNDDEETDKVIDGEGRLHTGDLGWLDENGYLHVSGRKKDIIIRNGNNLSVRKIEDAFKNVEGVAEVAVVGISHEMLGEVPCALVVMQNGCNLSEDGLLKMLETKLYKHELPVCIKFTELIPLTSTGKYDKQKIKELFQ